MKQKNDSMNSKIGHLKLSNHKSKKTNGIKKSEESIKYLNETIKIKICMMRVSKGEVNENGEESLFEEIMAGIFQN